MDISKFDVTKSANDGAFMQLLHPASNVPLVEKDGTKVGIYLLGWDSDVARNRRLKNTNKALNRKRGAAKVTAEELDARSVRDMAECGVDWQGFDDKSGKPIEFSKEAFEEMLTNESWIREQCDAFIGDRENFLL